jgi:hypothetical protein
MYRSFVTVTTRLVGWLVPRSPRSSTASLTCGSRAARDTGRGAGPLGPVGALSNSCCGVVDRRLQHSADLANRFTETIVKEQQADCFAGAYSRWVAEGHSPRFTLSTGEGLNRVLAGAISLADPVWSEQDSEMVEEGHGTALDRTRAFQQGFVDGTASCAAIDLTSIEQQRGGTYEAARRWRRSG